MKHIYKWMICVLLISCATDDNLLENITFKGGFIAFEEVPAEFNYNFLDLAEFEINAPLVDPNNNALSYSLALEYEGTVVEDFIVLNSFPSNLQFDIPMIVSALGITEGDLNEGSVFSFQATVTTANGVYTVDSIDFNTDTNTQEGGNTAGPLLGAPYKNAMAFSIKFFVPPPKKLRGTSFEEPFAAADPGADYVRAPGEGNDDEGELFNHAGERHVMHVATGNGEDDEIGFRSFFFSNGSGGFANEEAGVTQKTADVDIYPDGIQGFQLEDIDGLWRLVFDKVTVDANANPSTGVQIKFFPRSTSWESSDTIHIYVEVEYAGGATETIELMDLSGSGINDIEDKWNTVNSGFLSNVVAYTLTIDSEISSSSEEFYFDEMLVYVPED